MNPGEKLGPYEIKEPLGAGGTAGDMSDPTTATPRINVVLNWFEELKQRVPTGRQ